MSPRVENALCFRSLTLGLGLLLVSCGPGEARDPGDVLGDYREHNGVDARNGVATGASETKSRVASRKECHAAATRIETLALEMAVAEEPDAAKRAELEQRMQAELAGKGFQARVERQTEGCLGRETISAEAQCIAKIRTAEDLDRCPSP
jgi:hypothetical protein